MFAIWHGLTGNSPETLYQSAVAIFFAGFFDLCDGRVARLTKTQSEFGVQLDSLADLVSFGVAPALLVQQWALRPLGVWGFLGIFLYVACGAIRLARFNVMVGKDNQDPNYFIGLPIPLGAAVLIASLVTHLKLFDGLAVKHPEWILVLIISMGLLMISTVQFWSFKSYKFNRQTLMLGLIFIFGAWWFRLHYPTSLGILCLLGFYTAAGLTRFTVLKLYSHRRE
ncbi:MAG: CDP-diacylglycerol--serine O-phosphatidyltransferase [Deltaproteobacteria bacterium]|nr:CDP-diacylglycerol--serine O-phosphatidyltransferase [Deltaproteobacteria bacterium]